MSRRKVTFSVSEELYQQMKEAQALYQVASLAELAKLAVEEKVEEARRRAYYDELEKLREGFQEAGGLSALDLGDSQEEIIESLRKTRQEIFDREYADLYRQ
jgi:hypothetical protein